MKPKWTQARVKLGDIDDYQGNPRMSTKAQAKRIIASEKKFGQPVPFLLAPAIDGRFPLLDGHQRKAAWLTEYGADFEVDAMVSNRPLTDDEHKEMIITLHTGATGSWDWNTLSGWNAPQLQEWGMDKDALKGWNNDANNLKELLRAETPTEDTEPQIDRAEELREKWGVEAGQLWQLGEHRLICGDCTDNAVVDRVMGGEKADAIFTDPPYGMNYKGRDFGKNGIENDGEEFQEVLRKANEVFPIDNGVIALWFGTSRQDKMFLAMAGRNYHRSLFMYKPNGLAYTWHGWILTSEIMHLFSVGKPKWIEENHHHDVYLFDYSERPDKDVDHPTVKPLSICADIMSKIEGAIIYEPFSGSGTTIIACENLGRKCRAVEISPAYVAVALERWSQHTGKTPVKL